MLPDDLPLHASVVRQTLAIRGADEHVQIASLITSADKFRLSDATAWDLARTLSRHTHTIESNIDLIRAPQRPIWIEFNEAPRRRVAAVVPKGQAVPERIGLLVVTDPDDDDRVLLMTAWDFENGNARHSYATVSFSLTDFAQMAWGARNRYSRDPVSSVQRLLAEPHVDIPPGLGKELRIQAELEDPDGTDGEFIRLVNSARRDVMSEFPFALAALLSLLLAGSVGNSDGMTEIELPQRADRLADRLFNRFRTFGFIRSGSRKSPDLSWRAPAA